MVGEPTSLWCGRMSDVLCCVVLCCVVAWYGVVWCAVVWSCVLALRVPCPYFPCTFRLRHDTTEIRHWKG